VSATAEVTLALIVGAEDVYVPEVGVTVIVPMVGMTV
jgi:hypothetical protein